MLGRETIRGGRLRAVVVNSKVSNVATGARGLENARRMAAAAAAELGTTPDRVLVSSTGVIGVQLPIEKVEQGIRGAAADLQADPLVGALGIMTTDTRPKALSIGLGPATLTWVAKGAGMIEPNMATMLVYIFTDARFAAADLDRMLREAVDGSFNMLSVDTDTSTSDTCAILANGLAGDVDDAAFQAALTDGCLRVTEMLARDGEGATKLLRVTVREAADQSEARRSREGHRQLAAHQDHGARRRPQRRPHPHGHRQMLRLPHRAGPHRRVHQRPRRGRARDPRRLRRGRAPRVAWPATPWTSRSGSGPAPATATAYGCDLSAGYIEENAAYYSS